MRLCKNYINLYQTKIDKIKKSIQKNINDINFQNLHFSYSLKEKNTFQDIAMKSILDKIKLPKLHYEFILEEHFINLFTNEDYEYTK